MSAPDTPKRRLLRKSALQASPFGAPVKSFHNPTSSSASSAQPSSPISSSIAQNQKRTTTSPAGSPTTTSTTTPNIFLSDTANNNPLSSAPSTPKKTRQSMDHFTLPPATPKKKTILKTGIWGHVVGLKKQDESVYYRYPIDKSYCSFGRNDTNDIRVQIEAVSEQHCKLIRRDDGEVWLKDTSLSGTLLNNVLVHDTARPIQNNDVLTIAGRKFRFESSLSTTPRTPLQTSLTNTPSRQVRSIQESIDREIQSLGEAPSPTANRSALMTTPKRAAPPRTPASLESSLGLFTPNRAAKLSSLLVSPKPIPMPAFLAKSPRKPGMTPKVFEMIDEPSPLNPPDDGIYPTSYGLKTPTKDKRKAPSDFADAGRTPKKVTFGPALSPEVFDKTNPPSTPVKRGQQQDPDTPRRSGISTPSLLSRMGTPRPILTPSRSGRITVYRDLQTPATPKIFLPQFGLKQKGKEITKPVAMEESRTEAAVELSTEAVGQVAESLETEGALAGAVSQPSTEYPEAATEPQDASCERGSGSDEGQWKRFTDVSAEDEAPVAVEEAPHNPAFNGLDDDDDETPPSTPTRRGNAGHTSSGLSTPTRPSRSAALGTTPQEHSHHAVKLNSSPFAEDGDMSFRQGSAARQEEPPSPTIVSNNPMFSDNGNPFDDESEVDDMPDGMFTPPRQISSHVDISSPVHTPEQRRLSRSIQNRELTPYRPSSSASSSRQILLQLSAQKIQGLPDLLQSASGGGGPPFSLAREDSGSVPSTPTRPKVTLPLFDPFEDETEQEEGRQEQEQEQEQDDVVADEMIGESEALESPLQVEEKEEEIEKADAEVAATTSHITFSSKTALKSLRETTPVTTPEPKRRSSAPATTTSFMDRSQSPIMMGLRGVFRTPQKVVESCFAGFAGFRNFVRTPTKSPSSFSIPKEVEPAKTEEGIDGRAPEADAAKQKEGAVATDAGVALDVDEGSVQSLEVQAEGEEEETEAGSDERAIELDLSFGQDSVMAAERDAQLSSSVIEAEEPALTPSKSPATTPKRRLASHQDVLAILMGRPRESSPMAKEFSLASIGTLSSMTSKSLDQIKARGRRSDILPLPRILAGRSQSQTRGGVKDSTDAGAQGRRRRTISMIEFQSHSSIVPVAEVVAVEETTRLDGESKAEEEKEAVQAIVTVNDGDKEEFEQAALLELLGDGAPVSDESELEGEVGEDDCLFYGDLDVGFGGGGVFADHEGAEEEESDDRAVKQKITGARGQTTPTRRRTSFKHRLGSSSPAFRRYEQQGGEEDEEDEEDEDDVIMLITPTKRARHLY